MSKDFATADLTDEHPELEVLEPIFVGFGKKAKFSGAVKTIKVFEDNTSVKRLVKSPGEERVLVIDGGGSMRCSLVGDNLARFAIENGWNGILVFGAIRDSAVIDEMEISIKALGTFPKKSVKRAEGLEDIALKFAGVTISPGDYIYSDEDGIIISPKSLLS